MIVILWLRFEGVRRSALLVLHPPSPRYGYDPDRDTRNRRGVVDPMWSVPLADEPKGYVPRPDRVLYV